jgi:putative tributyrin esterase
MGIVHYTFRSRVLRQQTSVVVVLPTFARRESPVSMEEFYRPGKKYRTLYVLHGGSDDCTYYVRNTGIERYAQEGGFAAVMPEVRLSFYCDMRHGGKYLTFINEELPEVVESVFPLSRDWHDRFVVGNSMGSHGAMKWAMTRPDFFAAAAGMSGVGDVEDMGFFAMGPRDGSNPVLCSFGTADEYRGSANDLRLLARRLAESKERIPRLFSCCGTEDPYYPGVKRFVEYAGRIGLPLTFEEGPGGHQWEFWDRWLVRIIDWMGIRG